VAQLLNFSLIKIAILRAHLYELTNRNFQFDALVYFRIHIINGLSSLTWSFSSLFVWYRLSFSFQYLAKDVRNEFLRGRQAYE
jgi:hypothetical protein